MRKIIKDLKKKLVNEIWYFLFRLVKKTAITLITFCKIYKFISKNVKAVIIKLLKIFYIIFIYVKYYFFKIKLHLYDNLFCVILYFVWVNFGFRWIFYNVLNHYFWNAQVQVWWYYMPDRIYYLITEEYYYKIKIFIWFFRRNKRRFIKKQIFYIDRYQKFFANNRKDILKVSSFVVLCVFITALFIKFVFISVINIQIILITKRIISFVISSIKYFVLFLKFKCYFFFLKHSNKYNLNKKRKYRKRKSFLIGEYFFDINDFDSSYFNIIIKSIMKSKNIFYYYKFRRDLKLHAYIKKLKLKYTNKVYNRILYRLIKKNKLFFRKQRWVIWLKNLWIYSVNFNFFYFYKTFFFSFNFIYFNINCFLNTYLDFYLKFIIYLAA